MIIEQVREQMKSAMGPVVKILKQSDSYKMMVIGLKKGAVLKEHKTIVPATLIITEYYFALFMFLVLFFRIFLNQRVFVHAWWSVGFVVAALTNSALKYASVNQHSLPRIIAGGLLLVLTMLITYMLVKSLYLFYKKSLF